MEYMAFGGDAVEPLMLLEALPAVAGRPIFIEVDRHDWKISRELCSRRVGPAQQMAPAPPAVAASEAFDTPVQCCFDRVMSKSTPWLNSVHRRAGPRRPAATAPPRRRQRVGLIAGRSVDRRLWVGAPRARTRETCVPLRFTPSFVLR
jgi:hypothetical protein